MFDKHRQPWQCSIITDCRGKLSCFCQLAAPTVCWLIWGTADTNQSPRHCPGRGGGGGGGQLVDTND